MEFFKTLIVAMLLVGAFGSVSMADKPLKSATPAAASAAEELAPMLVVAPLDDGKATAWGRFSARTSSHFKSVDHIVFYVEPRDYRFEKTAAGFKWGVSMDITLTQGGRVLSAKDNFLDANFDNAQPIAKIYLNADLHLTGIDAGE